MLEDLWDSDFQKALRLHEGIQRQLEECSPKSSHMSGKNIALTRGRISQLSSLLSQLDQQLSSQRSPPEVGVELQENRYSELQSLRSRFESTQQAFYNLITSPPVPQYRDVEQQDFVETAGTTPASSAKQSMHYREQNKQLDYIHGTVSSLKEIGYEINDEINVHTRLLEDIESREHEIFFKVKSNESRLKYFMENKNASIMCMWIAIVVLSMIFLLILLSTQMSNPPSPKRSRTVNEDASSNRPKYPFVDYDLWMTKYNDQYSSSQGPGKIEYKHPSPTAVVGNFIRPPTSWFSFNEDAKITTECMSAQYSNVAHSPFVQVNNPEPLPESDECSWIDKTLLAKYIETKKGLVYRTAPSWYCEQIFLDAVVADVIANAARRDPSKYATVKTPEGSLLFGISENTSKVSLVVSENVPDTLSDHLPWEWEESHRSVLVSNIVDGYDSLIDFGDMIVPIRGLVCSVFFAGLIFRLGQLFQKVSVVRSPLSMNWDDRAFIVCIGKRKMNKYVEKAMKMVRRLVVVPREGQKWGYVVPPVCLKDPTVCTWIREMNRGLMTSIVYEKSVSEFSTLERWMSSLRIKKYVFWEEAKEERLVGFYFGSFNPVHENHIALVKYARERLGMEKVFIVPNQDGNKEKEGVMVSIEHRLGMVKARIAAEPGLGYLETIQPVGNTQRWETKANIAEGTTNKLFENSRFSGQPVLLLGQDSWNKAVIGSSRDKTTRHFIGIAKIVKSKIFVFPRSANSTEEIVNPPKPIRDLVKVIEGYVDPIEGLSSSSIRDRFRAGTSNVPEHSGLHKSVKDYIDKNRLYT